MEYKLTKKLKINTNCFVCGDKNPFSLKMDYYSLEDKFVLGIFNLNDNYQSYPNRAHGGIISTIIDETAGRAMQLEDENIWGVTTKLSVKFLKPVPLNKEIYAVSKITKSTRLLKTISCFIFDKDNNIYAKSESNYLVMDVRKIDDNPNYNIEDDLHESSTIKPFNSIYFDENNF